MLYLFRQVYKKPDTECPVVNFRSGAGGENRTLVTCLEGRYISHYTTPADFH